MRERSDLHRWRWKRFSFSVHRLVASAFIGPCPEEMEIDHFDGNKLNNHVANLRYVTKNENAKAAIFLGNWPRQDGEHHSGLKLSDRQVMEIRRLYLEGMSQHRIATEFGIVQQHVSKIVNGKCRRKQIT